MNTKSCIFTSSEATREYTAFDVHEYTGKINFSIVVFFFMLKFDFFFISVRQSSPQKTNFFPSHCASILWCSTYLLGIINWP